MATAADSDSAESRPRGLAGVLVRLIGNPGGLVRGSLSGAAMRMIEVLLGLTSLTLLARSLGPSGLGVYALGMATVMLVGFVHAGLPMLTAREVSIAGAHGDNARVKGVILFAAGCALASATVLAACSAAVVLVAFRGDSAALLWSLGLLPAFALSSLASSTLAGLRRYVAGQSFDLIVRPGLFVLLLLVAVIGAPHWLTPARAFMLQVAAATVSALTAGTMVIAALPREVRAVRPVFEAKRWLKAAAPMSITVGLQIAQASAAILFLGAFSSYAQVGAFRVAQRGGDIGGFGLTSVGFTAGPEIARLHATGDRARLQRVLHRASVFAFAVASCVFVGYAVADQRLLRWVFGSGFERAYVPLLICTGAQVINAFFGVNGTVLVMCGRERVVTLALFVSVTVQVLVSPLLIPPFGSTGAALSLALSFLIWNVILWRAARVQLDAGTSVFEFSGPGRTPTVTDAPVDVAIFLPSMYGGGAERSRLILAEQLARRGIRVEFVLLNAYGAWLEHVPKDIPIVDLGVQRFRDGLMPLSRYLRSRRPKAMLADMWPLPAFAVIARALAGSSTRIVACEHTDWKASPIGASFATRLVLRAVVALTYRQADGIVGVSDGVCAELAHFSGISRNRMHSISNTAPLSRPPESDMERPIWPSGPGPKLLAVGRMVSQKDHATLFRAIAEIRRVTPARLVLLGEGPLRAELEALRSDLGLDDAVAMPGFDAHPVKWYADADLFVHSSTTEGFGSVIVEALSCGIPVVSTDCPSGPRDILADGKFGRLVPMRDAKALADAIDESLAAPHDREALIRRAGDYSVEKYVDAYLALLMPQDSEPVQPGSLRP